MSEKKKVKRLLRGKKLLLEVIGTFFLLHTIIRSIMEQRLILQTNPLEHSAVANNCAIDAHGWAEPGAKIKVNGRELPVASDGLFIEQMSPSPEGTIVLEADSSDAQRTIIRKFKLLY